MSSEQCSFDSILPTNYRHRAEAFARDLQQRLWSLGSGQSSSNEERLDKHAHPAFEPKCSSMFADFVDEDSAPRTPTEDPVDITNPLGQSPVNRSDGLPIPHSVEPLDSTRCSFSSDSQQSIYSTPSENFNPAACAKLAFDDFRSVHSTKKHTDVPVDSCDLFLDFYSTAPFSDFNSKHHRAVNDYSDGLPHHNGNNLLKRDVHNPGSLPEEPFNLNNVKQSTKNSHLEHVNGDVIENSYIKIVTEENENDNLKSLENSLSQINLNWDVSSGTCHKCENSSISRLENSENESVKSSPPDAHVDRNANELNKRLNDSESLNSSDIVISDSLNSTLNSCDSLNSSDTLISSDSLNGSDSNIPISQIDETEVAEECPESEDQEIGEENKTVAPEESQDGASECVYVKLQRSSSLKTWKTPPDTPGRKKIVRFADVLGLDLADIRTFMDEIPQVPRSAFSDLRDADNDMFNFSQSSLESTSVPTPKFLVPLFQQPGGGSDFFDKLTIRNVCLENAVVTDLSLLAVTGTIRVRNIDYDKSVFVRYTIDGWKSYADLKAMYVVNSFDGYSDQFSFVVYAHTLNIGDRLEFAILFQTKGEQFWDSNGGINYIFQCVPPPPTINSSPVVGSPSISDKYAGFY